MSFELLDSETTYKGKVFEVRSDQIRLPDGKITEMDIVVHNGAVTLIPLEPLDVLWFVRQYRHATGQELLELPAGTLESGEPPETCAAREIREEIGMAAGMLEKMGEFFMAPGYSTEYMYAYLATDLRPNPLKADADEFLRVEKYPLKQIFRLVESGLIQDSKTLACLYLLHKNRPMLFD
jgi:ADP-ribose pyrophosphatase